MARRILSSSIGYPAGTTDSLPANQRRVAAVVRLFIGVGILSAFLAPCLPTIAQAVDGSRGERIRFKTIAIAGLPVQRLEDGVYRIDIRSLRLRSFADDSENPLRSEVQLLENGEALTPHVPIHELAVRAGSFQHWKHQIDFRPFNVGAPPEHSSYTLQVPQYSRLGGFLRSRTAQSNLQRIMTASIVGAILLIVLLVTLRSRAAVPLFGCDDLRWRVTLVGIVAVGLSFALAPRWNRLVIEPDTSTYFDRRAIRAPLYPLYLRFWHPGDLAIERNGVHDDPHHPLLPAVRATKILWVASITIFLWFLSRHLSPWLLSIAFGWVMLLDMDRYAWSQLAWMDHVLTEPLNYCLTFVLCGLLCAYLSTARLVTALAIGTTATLLLLLRPSNLPVLGILGILAVSEWRIRGWKATTWRVGLAAATALLFVPLQYAANYYHHGRVRSPPYTGHCLASFAVQFATPVDVASIDDPKIRQVFERSMEVYGSKRTERYHPQGESLDVNLWSIAVPALIDVYGKDVDDFTKDHVLGTIASALIDRHPEKYRQMVLENLEWYWRWPIHGPLALTVLLSAVLVARGRSGVYLLTLFLGTMPFAIAILASILARPHERYGSQFAFAEYAVPLLFLAVTATHGRRLTTPVFPRFKTRPTPAARD